MSAGLSNHPATIDAEIAAYNAMKDRLEATCLDKWIVVHGGIVAGVFDDFQKAAADAVKRFGRGPYLIRRVGQKTDGSSALDHLFLVAPWILNVASLPGQSPIDHEH